MELSKHKIFWPLKFQLRAKYASANLYQAKQVYRAQKQMELSVQAGDLVGVLQKKDPMGDVSRWYVDNGSDIDGFVPSRVLMPIGKHDLYFFHLISGFGHDSLAN